MRTRAQVEEKLEKAVAALKNTLAAVGGGEITEDQGVFVTVSIGVVIAYGWFLDREGEVRGILRAMKLGGMAEKLEGTP